MKGQPSGGEVIRRHSEGVEVKARILLAFKDKYEYLHS